MVSCPTWFVVGAWAMQLRRVVSVPPHELRDTFWWHYIYNYKHDFFSFEPLAIISVLFCLVDTSMHFVLVF